MLITLRRIVQEIQAASDLDEALAIMVRRIKEALPIDACAVYLLTEESHQYILMAAAGLNPSLIGQIRLDRSEGLVGWVGESQELINLENAAVHPRGHALAETGEVGYHAFLGVPLIDYRQTLGVLVAWRRAEGLFAPEEAAFFVTLAARLAKVIHDADALRKVVRLLDGEGPGGAFIQGIQGAPNAAIGTLVLLDPLADLALIPDRPVHDHAAEEATFKAAVATAQEELRASSARLAADLPGEAQALFAVHVMLLGSNSLMVDTLQRIRAGNWAPGAWRDTIAEHARVFDRMDDPYLRTRAEDIRDIGRRVLIPLQAEAKASRRYPERCILVGEAVGITEMVAIPIDRLAGVVSQHGSALSHAAVLARALGIPAVVGLAAPLRRLDGREALVDGDRGRVYLQPSPALVAAHQRRLSEALVLSTRLEALCEGPAETADGVRIPLQVNAGLIAELAPARAHGAEGIGLFRTELAFMGRETFPAEDEQYPLYRTVLEAFAPMPVTLRTLDVGGDKILPYFPMEEDNPCLGCRGIRFALDHPEIFLIQLRAMLRANADLHNLHVLFPMISRVDEMDEALGLLTRAYRELAAAGQAAAKPRVGAMIEVPSAVYLAEALAKRVDFLSVGTNDLTQHLLAVDRNNAVVATADDSLHPAVLHAVRHVIEAAHRQSKPVGVCGELAGDPAGALLLLGMGADTLSMNLTSLAHIKWTLRHFTAHRARALLEEALTLEDGFAIHRLLDGALEEAGLGGRVPIP